MRQSLIVTLPLTTETPLKGVPTIMIPEIVTAIVFKPDAKTLCSSIPSIVTYSG